LEVLSANEKDRGNRFYRERDRCRFIVAHGALRTILAEYLHADPREFCFASGRSGKPFLPATSLRFNVSHSGELAVVGVAFEREVGIDIEEHRDVTDALRIAVRFFAAGETERLQRIADDPVMLTTSFLRCWTRKEAFVKAVGQGLSYPLDSFEVSFHPDETDDFRLPPDQDVSWRLRSVDAGPGYHGALAFESRGSPDDVEVSFCDWQAPRP
jgi:4'-phosphopantetheinyl transferase